MNSEEAVKDSSEVGFAPDIEDSAEELVGVADTDLDADDEFNDEDLDSEESAVDDDDDQDSEDFDDEDDDLDQDEDSSDVENMSASGISLPTLPITGEPRVDDALARLGDLAGMPVSEHAEVFEDVHRRLHGTLADLAG